MSRVAIVSSGDPEKDQRDIENFQRSNDRIEAGCCPNGCGGMVEVDSHNAECPRCHFALFQSGGLNFPKQGGAAMKAEAIERNTAPSSGEPK